MITVSYVHHHIIIIIYVQLFLPHNHHACRSSMLSRGTLGIFRIWHPTTKSSCSSCSKPSSEMRTT